MMVFVYDTKYMMVYGDHEQIADVTYSEHSCTFSRLSRMHLKMHSKSLECLMKDE